MKASWHLAHSLDICGAESCDESNAIAIEMSEALGLKFHFHKTFVVHPTLPPSHPIQPHILTPSPTPHPHPTPTPPTDPPSNSKMSTFIVYVDQGEHGKLIGRGGSVCRTIESETGASLTIPRRSETSDAIILSGSEEAIQGAIDRMVEVLGHAVSDSPLVTLSLDVDSGLYGRLIGPRGSTLRGLEEQCEVSISIPRRGEDGYVTVKGSSDAVNSALIAMGDVLGLAPDVVGRDPPLGEDEMDVTGTAIAGAVDFSRWGPGELNEALFFSGLEDNQNEDSLDRFLSFILGAKHSLDICVFTISEPRIVACILKQAARGISCRIITDETTMDNVGSDIVQLRDAGIPVRIDNSPGHMHHKTCILDARNADGSPRDGGVLINGSLNWTSAASSLDMESNCENVMIVNHPNLMAAFCNEFERLWSSFDDL